MNRDIAIYAAVFFTVVLMQVLIFNHIVLFNVAIPFVYILFILRLPINLNLNVLYTVAFFSGFLVDLFSDTPGVNALSALFMASLKRPVFFAYVTRDDKTTGISPSLSSLGWATYSKFLISMTAIFCLLNFSIEYFNFASVKEIAIMTVSSTLLSFILIIAADSLVATRNEHI